MIKLAASVRAVLDGRIKPSQIKLSLIFGFNLAKLGCMNWTKSSKPDLQLNTAAFGKFNCLTWKNLALIYTAAHAEFNSNLFLFFHGIVTLICHGMFKNFDSRKYNFSFVDAVNCRLWYANHFLQCSSSTLLLSVSISKLPTLLRDWLDGRWLFAFERKSTLKLLITVIAYNCIPPPLVPYKTPTWSFSCGMNKLVNQPR